ncbi:MAG: carbohydrate kinase [Clostridia bacterium]|nr:carbohydrate kinase [Clostridia bacterium]
MILFIGEILADVVMDPAGRMQAYLGGAPFNAAVAAGRAGKATRFVGRIGDDPIGKFLSREVKKYPVDAILQTDPVRPTTIAFVSLDENGERDFKFLRHDSADVFTELSDDLFLGVGMVHLGSLMLSSEYGRSLAQSVVKRCESLRIPLSFDVNFRADIFPDRDTARAVYLPFVQAADVVKFSEEETEILFGKNYQEAFLREINNPIAVVTLGKAGCAVKRGKDVLTVPTVPVRPVDTTGAGDAFFGTFLAGLDGENLSSLPLTRLQEIAARANAAGAAATARKGAL